MLPLLQSKLGLKVFHYSIAGVVEVFVDVKLVSRGTAGRRILVNGVQQEKRQQIESNAETKGT